MKIAVLFSGMARYHKKCASSILDYFDIPDVDVDFFIHSWTNTWFVRHDDEKGFQATSTRVENNDKNQIVDELTDLYNPKGLIVEDQLENEDLENQFLLFNKFHETNSRFLNLKNPWMDDYNSLSHPQRETAKRKFLNELHCGQIYSIQKSCELMSDYENSTRQEYDVVIRFRLDNFIQSTPKDRSKFLMEKYKKDCYARPFNKKLLLAQWITMHRGATHVGDKFFCSDSETFNAFNYFFDFHINRIFRHLTGQLTSFQFTPEAVLGDFVMYHDWVCRPHIPYDSARIFNYRDYHLEEADQSFDNLFKIFIEKN
tara:strand:+ start:1822 stop:2763 length:942 start_codon:yes stop_codon:yes gene_type:complete